MISSGALTTVRAPLILPFVTRRKVPQLVSVPELARDLGMRTNQLYWYLDRVKAKTEQLGTARNSVRFVRRDQVLDLMRAIEAYRERRPPGLTSHDVARQLGIAPSTVRVLVMQGKLKARHSGTRLIFTAAEVLRYGRGRRPRAVA